MPVRGGANFLDLEKMVSFDALHLETICGSPMQDFELHRTWKVALKVFDFQNNVREDYFQNQNLSENMGWGNMQVLSQPCRDETQNLNWSEPSIINKN